MPVRFEDDEDEEQNRFTMQGISALYTSSFALGFSSSQRQAAIRALLRHDAHQDGTHYHIKQSGGLHPAYAAFNPVDKSEDQVLRSLRTELVEASVGDLFDMVQLMDCFHLFKLIVYY